VCHEHTDRVQWEINDAPDEVPTLTHCTCVPLIEILDGSATKIWLYFGDLNRKVCGKQTSL